MASNTANEIGSKSALDNADTIVPQETAPTITDSEKQKKFRNGRVIASRIIFDLFCLSWIAPVIILLFLNFKGWIIGAGVACRIAPFQNDCNIWRNPHVETAILDDKDHEILGALQIVAKALEVWFTIIAGSLVLDLAILLSVKGAGLPMGHFMTYLEFTNITTLLNPTFWKSSGIFDGGSRWHKASRRWLWAFIIFVIMLCIGCNLMGPATAVLAIPTLGWSEINLPTTQAFGVIQSSTPPSNTAIAPTCPQSALTAGNFTCTDYFSASVDEMLAGLRWRDQLWMANKTVMTPVTADNHVSFTYNLSYTWNGKRITWIPNRQMLKEMSKDFAEVRASKYFEHFQEASASLTYWEHRSLEQSLFNHYRNALDIVLRRKGPSLGHTGSCTIANVIELTLSSTKSVRCYNGTSIDIDGAYFQRCIRIGPGWTEARLTHSSFFVEGMDLTPGENVSVNVYSVDRSLTLNETTLPCLSEGQSSYTCNWDLMFSTDPSPAAKDFSITGQLFEYNLSSSSSPNFTVMCQSFPHLIFPEYTIQLTPSEINGTIVKLEVPSDAPPNPIFLHPDWILAAWSVPRSGTVNGNRATASNLVADLKWLANARQDYTPWRLASYFMRDSGELYDQHLIMYFHALSLVDFSVLKDAEFAKTTANDASHPWLTASKRLRVWAYGNGSRTFKLGAVVSIFGCLCVVIRTVVSQFFRINRPSTLEIVTAALKYTYQGDLDVLSKASEAGKLPFGYHRAGDLTLVRRF
jgi:hypothetical protein